MVTARSLLTAKSVRDRHFVPGGVVYQQDFCHHVGLDLGTRRTRLLGRSRNAQPVLPMLYSLEGVREVWQPTNTTHPISVARHSLSNTVSLTWQLLSNVAKRARVAGQSLFTGHKSIGHTDLLNRRRRKMVCVGHRLVIYFA